MAANAHERMVTATPTATELGSPERPPAAAGATVAPGHIIGARYRVVEFIAAGGMGEVYLVEDLLLQERVALKLLRRELAGKPDAVARFAQEIRLARRVTHSNVCRVFDVGADGERVFFTMEHVPGETLAARLRRLGAHDVDQARPIVEQLLRGIAAAHAADIVHADLKPSNVLLTGAGPCVVITDFGLALPCCAEFGCRCAMPHLLGTPAYMAPEQVTGGAALARTDVFALGVILFELVTGALPWTGDSPRAIAFARLEQPPPWPSQLRPDLDRTWCETIRRCLAREPAERLAGVGAVRTALGLG